MNMPKIGNTAGLAPSRLAAGLNLKPGQIVQGSITKLYPQNKAEIKLGNERMIAMLEVGLKIGGKYHFQVQSTGSVINLKVIAEQMKTDREISLRKLMEKLGVKQTRANINLMKNINRLNIPFDIEQFHAASELLKVEKNKPAAMKIILEMMRQNLPMRPSVFHALTSAETTSLSEQYQSVLLQLKDSTIHPIETKPEQILPDTKMISESALKQLITTIAQKPEPFHSLLVKEIISQAQSGNQMLFRSLQAVGNIPLSTDFPEWQQAWISFSRKAPSEINLNESEIKNLPFLTSDEKLARTLQQISGQTAELQKSVSAFIKSWGEEIRFAAFMNEKMPEDRFIKLKNDLETKLFPHLSGLPKAHMASFENTPEILKNLHSSLQALLNNDGLTQLLKIFKKGVSNEQFLNMTPKQQFLEQLHLYLSSAGLNYEHQLLNGKQPQDALQTIKGMLLELAASPHNNLSETQTKLIHLLNGLQLNSVNETESFIQANLQIPAERLGLVNDLKLTFEGKKQEDGKVNPDFCRVLFFLELSNLKETIIDMTVQNRSISLTIYNDSAVIEQAAKHLSPALEQHLKELNYHFSGVHFKPLEKERTPQNVNWDRGKMNLQGVDYRI